MPRRQGTLAHRPVPARARYGAALRGSRPTERARRCAEASRRASVPPCMQVLTLAPSPPHRCAEAPRRARLATGHGHLQGQLVRHARPDLPGRDVPVLLSAWSRERDRVGLGEVHCAPLLCARHGARPGSWGGEMRCYPITLCEYGLRACVSEQMPNRPRARRRGAWSLVSSPQLGGPAPRRTRGSRDLKTRRADGDARGTPAEVEDEVGNHRVPRGMCRRTCVSVVQIVNRSLGPNSHRVPLASVRHTPRASALLLAFILCVAHCGDTSALILKRPRWLSQPGDDQIRQAAISPDVGSRIACR